MWVVGCFCFFEWGVVELEAVCEVNVSLFHKCGLLGFLFNGVGEGVGGSL